MIQVATFAGTGKPHSEDAVLCADRILVDEAASFTVPCSSFVAVADGVEGCPAGETAAQFVLSALKHCTPDTLLEQLTEIHHQLLQAGRVNPGFSGMATTLTGVYLSANNPLLFHVGNTRAYTLQGRYLKQLTADHTLASWYSATQQTQQKAHCGQNTLLNYFGGTDAHAIDRLTVTILPKIGTLLLTSDGVHDYISADTMEEILASDLSDMEKCRHIADEALRAYSSDDRTVVLIRWDDLSEPE